MLRFLVFTTFFFIHSIVWGQVEAIVEFGSRSDADKTIRITWSAADETRWISEHQDRLDIMALNTSIEASMLPVGNDLETVYHFDIHSPNPIELLFELVSVAPGETISIVNSRNNKVLFSSASPSTSKSLTEAVEAEFLYIEWTTSDKGVFKSDFKIDRIFIEPQSSAREMIGFNTAYPCHPNAACKQDSLMRLISNSAMRIRMVMDEGIGWCSGSFVNNSRNDLTPYVLLAYHCTFNYTPQYDLWRFDLEYKSDSCNNPASEPQIISLTGCERKAGGQASDFLLVVLTENVPLNYNVTFLGWDRDSVATPDTTFLIHHPNADIRKFSTSTNKAVIHPNQIGWSEGYTTPGNHHFRFKFTEGGHQAGSSGGPVFNQNGLLVAQLHGGSVGCEESTTAFAGRLSRSWNLGPSPSERLKDWLDPDNTGIMQLQSIENLSADLITDIKGTLTDYAGRPVANATIVVSGSVSQTLTTDANGQFEITGVNRNGQYHIVPAKNTNPLNGVSSFDLLKLQKHVLQKEVMTEPWKLIAGDATNNQSISAGDIVVLLKLILGKITALPSLPSWVFVPPFIDLQSLPPGEPIQVEFQAIKIGDVNGNADPGQ